MQEAIIKEFSGEWKLQLGRYLCSFTIIYDILEDILDNNNLWINK